MLNKYKPFAFMPFLEADGGSGGDTTQPDQTQADTEPQKTFTQNEVNTIAAREKRQGAAGILKALGFDTEEAATAFITKYREQEEANKSDLEKANSALAAAQAEQAKLQAQALAAERRASVMEAGVKGANARDVVLLAEARMDDKTDFDAALEQLKKDMPTFFGEARPAGTGSAGGKPPRKPSEGGAGSLGKRLAEAAVKSTPKENPYFSN